MKRLNRIIDPHLLLYFIFVSIIRKKYFLLDKLFFPVLQTSITTNCFYLTVYCEFFIN